MSRWIYMGKENGHQYKTNDGYSVMVKASFGAFPIAFIITPTGRGYSGSSETLQGAKNYAISTIRKDRKRPL